MYFPNPSLPHTHKHTHTLPLIQAAAVPDDEVEEVVGGDGLWNNLFHSVTPTDFFHFKSHALSVMSPPLFLFPFTRSLKEFF